MADAGAPEPSSASLFGMPSHDGPDDPPAIPGFEILRRIGRGGQADVWLALQRKPLNRRVAIKVFSARHASDDVLRRFQAEREALARLPSSGFCPIYEAGVAGDGRPYIVLEYVDGPNLLAACASPEASPDLVLCLLERLARTLAVAHRMGLVHLDLKPGNVLVSAWPDMGCEPRIIDFGLARDAGSRLPAAGTPGYSAPELASSSEASPLCDIYSLGCIMRAALEECAVLRASRAASDLRALAEECCAPHPRERPPSAELVAERLRSMMRRPGLSGRRTVASALVAVAAIGLGLVLMRGGTQPPADRTRVVGEYRCIDLSPHYNAFASQLREGHNLPAGLQVVAGVPVLFAAPAERAAMRACAISGAIGGTGRGGGGGTANPGETGGSVDERRYIIQVDMPRADEVVLVLNTLWGSPGQELIDIEFDSGDHVQRVTLKAGRDVRDYLRGQLTEDGLARPAVKFGPEHELDAVTVTLDSVFAHQGLKSLTLIDRGKNGVSRILLFAVSVRNSKAASN